jgi:hypothetical protein
MKELKYAHLISIIIFSIINFDFVISFYFIFFIICFIIFLFFNLHVLNVKSFINEIKIY